MSEAKTRKRKTRKAEEQPQPALRRIDSKQGPEAPEEVSIARTDGEGTLHVEGLPVDTEVVIVTANDNKTHLNTSNPAKMGDGMLRQSVSVVLWKKAPEKEES